MQIDEVIAMLSDIVQELDYDIWKDVFGHDAEDDNEDAADTRARLIAIVRKYINE